MRSLADSAFSHIRNFTWRPNVTPLSSPVSMLFLVVAYLALIGILSWLIRRPLKVPMVVPALHNLLLCLASALMFLGCAYESYQTSKASNSVSWLWCLPPRTKMQGPLYFWSYMYYLSKYWEFLDTVILTLRAKPLTFLHVFHHTSVVPMAYLWLEQGQSLQQIALLTNTGIHVIMYWYYFLTSLSISPWWKKLVTTSQIAQFVFSFVISIPFWFMHWRSKRGCSGYHAMIFNATFNLLLLLLFIQFHRQSYASRRPKRVPAASPSSNKQRRPKAA